MEIFQPLRDRVLLKRVDGGSIGKSGMIIPDAAKEKPTECEVIAVGASYTNEFNTLMHPPVSVGDHVLIGKYSGSNEIKLNGVEHVSVKWDELIGIKTNTPVPSAADLDAIAEEKRIAEQTSGAKV